MAGIRWTQPGARAVISVLQAQPPCSHRITVLTQPVHILLRSRAVSLLWDLGDTDTPPIDPQPEKALPRAVCLCISQGCQQHWDSPASSCTSLSPRSSGPRVSSPAWRAQRGWSGEDSVVLSALHHPCLPGRAQQVPPPLGSAGMSWRSLETAEGVIRPHPAPKPWGCTRLVVGPMPLCPFWLLKPLPALQQGAEPRADARHQERDFIL